MSDSKQMMIIGAMFLVLVALLGYTIYLLRRDAQLTAQGQ
jgi:hypothetical protein